jgi:hypothetical protein
MERQQRGLHSLRFTHNVYSAEYENMIVAMHQVLDRMLAI